MNEREQEDSRKSNGQESPSTEKPRPSSNQEEKNDGEKTEKEPGKPKGPPIYKKPAFIITVLIVAVVLIGGAIILWLILRQYVSTDDAYIDGNVAQISPQIAARLLPLRIWDNEFVHQGDVLFELDPTDYEVALAQAKAQFSTASGRLEEARAQVITARASVPQAVAGQHSAQATFNNASNDLVRFQSVDERARSKQQLDNAATAKANAEAQLEKANADVSSANANVTAAEAAVKGAEGEVEEAQAAIKKAEVNLSYCKIIAPCDGRITERTAQGGNYVTPGQALCLLVDPNVWVTANFKETQLTHVQPGQPVTIKVDAFPGHKFRGKVDSIQAGSGSRFSVLPAENATGNYVKVVQRVPVKILFDHGGNTNDAPMLSPGLSVVPRVKVR